MVAKRSCRTARQRGGVNTVFCKIRSLGLHGVTGYEVTAECDLSGGLPNFTVVGLPDTAVSEARDRVRAAVKNCGFTFPVSRITVNLAPAGLRNSHFVTSCAMVALCKTRFGAGRLYRFIDHDIVTERLASIHSDTAY